MPKTEIEKSRERLTRLMMEDFSKSKGKAVLLFERDEDGRLTIARREQESCARGMKAGG